MSEQTPSNEGFGSRSSPIEDMLRDVRETLKMDVAFVSQFSEDQLVFRALEGDAESFGWREGESFPIDESYCKRVLDGRIPRVVPDAKREDATKDLRVTTEADIGSYCGGAPGALRRAPLRHFVLPEPRARSVAQGARPRGHGADGEVVGRAAGAPRGPVGAASGGASADEAERPEGA